MQIVIEIPEDYYKIIKHDVEHGMDYRPCVIIANGTPIPKCHGDLIDKNNIIGGIHGVRSITTVLNAPIIIPAEKE